MYIFLHLSEGTMVTSQTCCHLPGKILNLAAGCADKAQIGICRTTEAANPIMFYWCNVVGLLTIYLLLLLPILILRTNVRFLKNLKDCLNFIFFRNLIFFSIGYFFSNWIFFQDKHFIFFYFFFVKWSNSIFF
jgi:hypothetical protein